MSANEVALQIVLKLLEASSNPLENPEFTVTYGSPPTEEPYLDPEKIAKVFTKIRKIVK